MSDHLLPPGPTWRPRASRVTLQRRQEMRAQVRAHFAASDALEVEVPLCQGGPNRDHGVQPAELSGSARWLTTSPEHPLKRLVAAGYGAVWCFQSCVRLGELGRLHRPEFTMLEWYRPGWSLEAVVEETVQLVAQLLAVPPRCERRTWQQVMTAALGAPPQELDAGQLRQRLGQSLGLDCSDESPREDLLDLAFATLVQPQLGHAGFCEVAEWPASACAQARLIPGSDGGLVAARSELFLHGVELANGYDECTSASDLRQRFAQHAAAPGAQGPQGEGHSRHDEAYLAALEHGMGPVSGIAVGFDRVVLLALGLDDVGDTMAFPWEDA